MSVTTPSRLVVAERPLLARAAWGRKAGRYDFERFDHLSSSGVSIGHQAIDKVNVDCCFLFRRSQWGTLGRDGNPAGIIYMDLTLDQPTDCKLVNAKVRVTLDEEAQGLQKFRDSKVPMSDCPAQFTDWFGPKQFSGLSKKKAVSKTVHATPYVNVLGNGIGGVGADFGSSFVHTSQWTFKGSRQPGKGLPSWAYRTLTWELTENDLEKHSVHSNRIHTAFTYENCGQPFLIRVEIRGQLVKTRHQLKNTVKGLMKFGPHKQEDVATTLIGPSYERRFRLDERARNLERTMELENQNSIPIEVADSQPVTFQQLPYQRKPSNTSVAETSLTEDPILSGPAGLLSGQYQARLNDGRTPGLLVDARLPASTDRTAPTLENLARIGARFVAPPRPLVPTRRETPSESVSEVSGHSSGTTLVGSTSELSMETQREDQVDETLEVPAVGKKPTPDPAEPQADIGFWQLLFGYLIAIMHAIIGSIHGLKKQWATATEIRRQPASLQKPDKGPTPRPKQRKYASGAPDIKTTGRQRAPG